MSTRWSAGAPGLPPLERLARRVREYLLVLLRRRGGHLPADPGRAPLRARASARWPSRATATCTRSRPRASAGWRCTAACARRFSWPAAAGAAPRSFALLRRRRPCSSPAGSSCLLGVRRRPLGARRAHQAGRAGRRGRRDGAARPAAADAHAARASARSSLGPEGVPAHGAAGPAHGQRDQLHRRPRRAGRRRGGDRRAGLLRLLLRAGQRRGHHGDRQERISAPTLIAVVLAGACLGFLPHNFNPARIFMGDSGRC